MSQANALVGAAREMRNAPMTTPLTRSQINRTMDASMCAPWHWRSAHDAIECATALRFASDGRNALQLSPDAFLDFAAELQIWAPTQTIRSDSSEKRELFSTPPSLAAAIALLADLQANRCVLEPSAGNGGLAGPISAFGPRLWLNEIDEGSMSLLKAAFPQARFSASDARVIHAVTAMSAAFDRVVLNPPFRHADTHLRAAFSCLQAGGVLVALLPARFRNRALIERCVGPEGCVDFHWTLDGSLFAHAGVSTKTTLVRVVKTIVHRGAATRSIASFAELRAATLQTVQAGPPIEAPSIAPYQPSCNRTPSRPAWRSLAVATTFRPPLPGRPMAFDIIEPAAPQPCGQSKIYACYQPSRLAIEAARPHASELVETMSMASVPLPPPTHQPRLPTRLIKSGLLSLAQLEVILYAGLAHERLIPGAFVPSDDGTDLVSGELGASYRYGVFLGDGTGVGKGRTVAGIIMDNLCRDRRKALWISESAALIEDARRDWTDLGGRAADIIDLKAVNANTRLTGQEGIFFCTYATLRRQETQATRSRLAQILELLGHDFDGVIIFDEAHAMGSAVETPGLLGSQSPSLTGQTGLSLQNLLPKARIVYASATGASHVRNIAYAARLGLWGSAHTPFADRTTCLSHLSSGGPAALELLIRELKGRGLYLARSLSYDGVEYEPLVHPLTDADKAVWDQWSAAWTIIHTHVQEALRTTGIVDDHATLAKTAKAAALSAFESTKLRFFSHLLQAIQAPTLIAAMTQDIAQGRAPIVQITSTNEAVLDRRLLNADDQSPDDLDFTPREYVIDYLERAFPTVQHEPAYDSENDRTIARPMIDEDGRTIHCPHALAARAALLERLVLMPECLGALDQIVQHFGIDRLSECTGRMRRLILQDGRRVIDKRGANANTFEAARFMDGHTDALIFSNAGGTGRSYHACLRAKNQKRRVHYLVEPGWRADKAIQGLGRSHRTNQVCAPLFRVLTTDLAGQKRFTSTITQRLETLGAFTRADRRCAGQDLFSPLDNLDGQLAQQAYRSWCFLLAQGNSCIGVRRFEELTGLRIVSDDGQVLADTCKLTRWLNRLLALPVDLQNAIFNEFYSLLEAATDVAREQGTLDREIEAITADSIFLQERHELPADTHGFLPAYVSVYKTRTTPAPIAFSALPSGGEVAGRFRCKQTGQPVLACQPRLAASPNGSPYTLVTCYTAKSIFYAALDNLQIQYTAIDDEGTFKALWAQALGAKPLTVIKLIYVLHGACLHLWRSLPAAGLRVRRITDNGGETVIGRLMEAEQARSMVAIKTQASLDVLVSQALSGENYLKASNGLMIARSRHMDKVCLVITRFERSQSPFYRELGAELVIHNYSPKLIVPIEKTAEFIESLIGPAWSHLRGLVLVEA